MQISIERSDFINMLNAAEFGIRKAEGHKSDFTLSAWRESFEKLRNMPLDDGRTPEERTQAFYDNMHAECAKYGCD